MLLQFWIVLFTGMVAATLVPPLRRSIPRQVEVGLWVALVAVCVIAVVSITNPVVRELTGSTFWGVDHVVSTLVGLLGAGIVSWISEHRFPIATGVVVTYFLDVFALALLGSYKKGQSWQPEVRLREWMELPRLTAAPQPVAVPYAIDELNRKWGAATAMAGAAMLSGLIRLSIWARDVMLPRQAERLARAAAVGRFESRARLESFLDTVSQLQFAARAYYEAAGVRAVKRGALAQPPTGSLADISVLVGAQSIGWYGPLRLPPAVLAEEEEEIASEHTGRLAS